MAMLTVENINVYYGVIHALKDISFQVNEGEIVALIGANGAGKTTLFKMIIGSEPPDSGQVVKAAGLKIGYLEQHACKGSSRTAYSQVQNTYQKKIT